MHSISFESPDKVAIEFCLVNSVSSSNLRYVILDQSYSYQGLRNRFKSRDKCHELLKVSQIFQNSWVQFSHSQNSMGQFDPLHPSNGDPATYIVLMCLTFVSHFTLSTSLDDMKNISMNKSHAELSDSRLSNELMEKVASLSKRNVPFSGKPQSPLIILVSTLLFAQKRKVQNKEYR